MKKILLIITLLFLLAGCTQQMLSDLRNAEQYPLPPPPTTPGVAASTSSIGKAVVPSWARTNNQIWAAEPVGIQISNLVNQKFDKINPELNAELIGYDLVWSQGYYTNVSYALQQIFAGAQLDPTKVWKTFTVQKPDGNILTTPQWMRVLPSDKILAKIPSQTFEFNTNRLNAFVLFACKFISRNAAYVEYDCNDVGSKRVKVISDDTLTTDSGRGSWMLKDFELTTSQALPPAPQVPGTTQTTGNGSTSNSTIVCTDSDGGKNYDLQGQAQRCVGTTCELSGLDSCVDNAGNQSSIITSESYCENQEIKWEYHTCLNGCSEGKCNVTANFTVNATANATVNATINSTMNATIQTTVTVGADLFKIVELTHDFIISNIATKVKYLGTDASRVSGKNFRVELKFKNITDTISSTLYLPTQVDLNYYYTFAMSLQLTPAILNEIKIKYPNGYSDYVLSIYEGQTKIFEQESTVRIVFTTDNFTYKIAMVQVVPSGTNLDDLNYCLLRDDRWTLQGSEIKSGLKENCATAWDWGTDAPHLEATSLKFKDIWLSDTANGYVTTNNVKGWWNQAPGSINTYSLKYAGKYWENLLAKHSIIDTRLKKNPKFELTFLNPIIEPLANSPTSSDHGDVKTYFANLVEKNNLIPTINTYDFVIFVYYNPDIYGANTFTRSFVAGRNAYLSVMLDEKTLFNSAFLTLVHEMGHQLFGLWDLYDGFALKYPEALPDPIPNPTNTNDVSQTKACIMAKNFAKTKVSATRVQGYDTSYSSEDLPAANLPRFYKNDPNNYILCVDDIRVITQNEQAPNPNCPIADFYLKQCGTSCTSENYLTSSCAK